MAGQQEVRCGTKTVRGDAVESKAAGESGYVIRYGEIRRHPADAGAARFRDYL